MVHPVTYVNKVLLYSSDGISLVNAMGGKILYQFSKFASLLQEAES